MATLKNIIVNDTGAIYLPSGTKAQRPTSPVDGDTRYNSDVGSIEYYYKGFWVDARTGAGGITHDGLVVYLNAGLTASYPGSGTTITNLGSGGATYNGTISGTATYSSADGGYLYGAPGNYVTVGIDYRTVAHTVISVCGYNGATKGRITTSTVNNWLLGHWSTHNGNAHYDSWVTGVSDAANGNTSTEWGVHVATGNPASDTWAYFKNGIVRARNNNGTNGPGNIYIGGNGENSDWKWSILLVYNRVLSDEEILKTTSAIRLRNGI